MRIGRASIILVLSCSLALPCFGATTKRSLINVTLQDSSSNTGESIMSVSVDHPVVKAGQVTLRATNQSRNLIHEVIVIKLDPSKSAIPYDDRRGQVIETRVKRLGEIADLQAGGTTKARPRQVDSTKSYSALPWRYPGHK